MQNNSEIMPPQLAVGLGNPGTKYSKQRHNAGFWFVDSLAQSATATFCANKKFFADIATTTPPHPAILKPNTYMNESGRAVAAYITYFNISPAAVLVAHDEADLPPGVVRLKFGGSAAGHNGIADINRVLQNRPYWRLRIGVGRVAGSEMANYVLAAPNNEERNNIDAAITRTLNVWSHIASGDYENAMHILHSESQKAKEEGTTWV